MKNIQKKWFLCVSTAMVMGLAASMMLHSMESEQNKEGAIFKDLLPEIQKDIRLQLMRDVVVFLGLQQPTIFAGLMKDMMWQSQLAVEGNKAVTAEALDDAVKIWDINTGNLLNILNGHTRGAGSVVLVGDKVVTMASDNIVKVWNVNTGKLIYTFEGLVDKSMHNSLAVAGDKVAAGSGNEIKIWDINTGKLLRTLEGFNDQYNVSVAIAGDKVATLTGANGNILKIWDISTGNLIHSISFLINNRARDFSLAIAGDKFVFSSGDELFIGDINTGQLLHKKSHHSKINSVAIAGEKVITGSCDKTAKIWNINTGHLEHTLAGNRYPVILVAVIGDKLVTLLGDGKIVKIWDINTGELRYILTGDARIKFAAVSGDKVVTSSADGITKVWSLSPNLQGTQQNNPLVWIVEKATIPQLDFIKRAYEATIIGQVFILDNTDLKTFYAFPKHVKQLLVAYFNMKLSPTVK